MEHLSIETIARLVDEAPTPAEREHLASCSECSEHLRALRAQSEALASLPSMMPPLGDWRELEARLASEGLLRRKPLPWLQPTGWMKGAAAIVFFLGGAMTGSAITAGDAASPGAATASRSVQDLNEAARLVEQTEQAYVNALVGYREFAAASGRTLVGAADPASRAAALEMLVAAGQTAVRQAPDDPFINGFLVNALAERQASSGARTVSASGQWY